MLKNENYFAGIKNCCIFAAYSKGIRKHKETKTLKRCHVLQKELLLVTLVHIGSETLECKKARIQRIAVVIILHLIVGCICCFAYY